MTNEDIIESVISLLAVDGSLNQQEIHFFNDLCKRLDVSKEAMNQALAKARQGKGRVHLPEEEADKKRLLYFLVQAIVADGTIASEESKILNAVVDRMGISREYVESFIQARLEEIKVTPMKDGIPTSWKKQIACPKCGYKQPESEQCARCGIIFEKYKQTHGPSDAEKLQEILASSNILKGKLL